MFKAFLLALLGVVAGVLAMGVVVSGVEWTVIGLFPLPPGLDPTRPDDLARILASAAPGALLGVVLAWVAGAFVGGAAAAAISRRWPRMAAACVGLVVVAAALQMQADIMQAGIMQAGIPGHPTWMTVSGVLLPVPAALMAAWLVRGRDRGTRMP